jgi:carboxypeptidase D
MIWVDQPVGTGFSTGRVTARNEDDVARQFMGFWRNFVDAFALQGYKVYVTGSSYSGIYCPYVAGAMLDANDKTYFDVSGMMIFDGLYGTDTLAQDIPTVAFSEQWSQIFAFNESFTTQLTTMADQCGYNEYMNKYLTFPAAGVQPTSFALPGLNTTDGSTLENCGAINTVFSGAVELNPCFSVYEISAGCPFAFDPLGFSAGTNFVPEGAGPVYFNRDDVKRAINAPEDGKDWVFCADEPVFVNGVDESILAGPGSQPVIPGVVDRTQNVIIGHGSRDFVLVADGALLAIQNMTWGGQLGFQSRPEAALYVPYHGQDTMTSLSGAGVLGTVHTERGLTYFGVAQAGHFLTQDQPAIAFRALEVLLGRVPSLQAAVPFTTDVNATAQPLSAMGNGTVLVGVGFEEEGFQPRLGAGAQSAAQSTTSASSRTTMSAGVVGVAALVSALVALMA